MSKDKKVSIVVIDDDDVDRESISRAFRKEKISNPIMDFNSARQALESLRGGEDTEIQKPYLILLDINMPDMNGHQFLEELRSDEKLANSIVFVLTTSDDETDKARAYEKQVAGYLLKKDIGKDFMEKVKMLDLFMISVEFPNGYA